LPEWEDGKGEAALLTLFSLWGSMRNPYGTTKFCGSSFPVFLTNIRQLWNLSASALHAAGFRLNGETGAGMRHVFCRFSKGS